MDRQAKDCSKPVTVMSSPSSSKSSGSYEFLRQLFAIPAGVLRHAVVGKQKRAFACLGQAGDNNGGNGLECEQLCSFESPVAGEQSTVLID
jgi:hypothetical protein